MYPSAVSIQTYIATIEIEKREELLNYRESVGSLILLLNFSSSLLRLSVYFVGCNGFSFVEYERQLRIQDRGLGVGLICLFVPGHDFGDLF